jgi:hypothetical protein
MTIIIFCTLLFSFFARIVIKIDDYYDGERLHQEKETLIFAKWSITVPDAASLVFQALPKFHNFASLSEQE